MNEEVPGADPIAINADAPTTFQTVAPDAPSPAPPTGGEVWVRFTAGPGALPFWQGTTKPGQPPPEDGVKRWWSNGRCLALPADEAAVLLALPGFSVSSEPPATRQG